MVLREDQEKATYTQKVDFQKLRNELLTADSTESGLTRTTHERLTNELTKLNNRLRDEIQRTQASVRLDLNLEKGRIREEANVQELKIKETETRIEQETAQLRERLEAVKFQTLQWLMYVHPPTRPYTVDGLLILFAGVFARELLLLCWVFGVCSCSRQCRQVTCSLMTITFVCNRLSSRISLGLHRVTGNQIGRMGMETLRIPVHVPSAA